MAKGYLRVKHTDPDGTTYEVNDPMEFSRETDEDKVNYDHLIAAGIIGKQPLSGAAEPDEDKAAESGRNKATRTSTTSR